jgi:heme exporter protein A
MIEVSNLDFEYPERPLLRKVNFTLEPGELLHLRGINGAGKTTLLKLLAGLLEPTRGEIRFNGTSIHRNRAAYQQNLCYIGHKIGISQLLTVQENCELALRQEREILGSEVLERFALQGLEEVPCSQLSAGQRRRVGLLRLLLTNASLWLLDEPLNALDEQGVYSLMNVIEAHLAQKGMVILTSHQKLPFTGDNYQEYKL